MNLPGSLRDDERADDVGNKDELQDHVQGAEAWRDGAVALWCRASFRSNRSPYDLG
jgi:hypothetical protein